MRALIAAAVILLSLSAELRGQTAVRPVDDGVPHYSSSATFVEVDSLRVADEPWATCNDPAVMMLQVP